MIELNHTEHGVDVLINEKKAGFIVTFGSNYVAKVNGKDKLCNSFPQATNYISEQVSAVAE